MQPHQQREYTQCLICEKPLGHDSRSEGYMFCHSHRICSVCDAPLSPPQLRLCLKQYLESLEGQEDEKADRLDYNNVVITHPFCQLPLTKFNGQATVTQDGFQNISFSQSDIDLLNLIRLTCSPDPELSQITNENLAMDKAEVLLKNKDLEKKILFEVRMEAVLSMIKIVIRKDPKFRKNYLEEREKEFKSTKSPKEPQDIKDFKSVKEIKQYSEKVSLEAMIELHGLNPENRSENIKIYENRIKTIKTLMAKMNLSEPIAQEMCDKSLIQSGVFKR